MYVYVYVHIYYVDALLVLLADDIRRRRGCVWNLEQIEVCSVKVNPIYSLSLSIHIYVVWVYALYLAGERYPTVEEKRPGPGAGGTHRGLSLSVSLYVSLYIYIYM